jgi:hypothetical protein
MAADAGTGKQYFALPVEAEDGLKNFWVKVTFAVTVKAQRLKKRTCAANPPSTICTLTFTSSRGRAVSPWLPSSFQVE